MRESDHQVIIIRGAPGSGKTQTAKCLAEAFPQGVKLEVDAIRKMVISVDWKNQEEHINMLRVSAGLVCEFLKLGFHPVIVVDTFSGDKFQRFVEAVHRFDEHVSIAIFGLFASDAELEARLRLRKDDGFKDAAITKKLNHDILTIKHSTEIQIDTSCLLPNQTARKILEHISVRT